ncbi:MAG: hypothetical protein JO168_11105 [Solirubrobacterales bacterium]|nr:hypothetical protein [Solirubrobacterales bacterium]MBV9717293.1 hypothetical protein [Solirubrobacterales bacterium]
MCRPRFSSRMVQGGGMSHAGGNGGATGKPGGNPAGGGTTKAHAPRCTVATTSHKVVLKAKKGSKSKPGIR